MKTTPASEATKAKWREIISAWRESGQTAAAFGRQFGCHPKTLQWWASRLGADKPEELKTEFVELIPRSGVVARQSTIVVEVGTARIRVDSGFDPKLLAAVLAALGGAR